MLKLKALLLTQGMHGMVSQVEGLANGLKLRFRHQKVKLKPLWNFIPPKFTPISENLLTEKFVCDSKIIISCGRKSVVPSIALKKRFGKEIFNIHIQDPKVSLKNFDLVICPEHDRLSGDNVISTKGSIHYLTKKEIIENSKYLRLNKEKKKIVAFIIGGPNNYYGYSEDDVHYVFNKIKALFTPDKYKIVVIPSYRTPEVVIKKAFNTFSFNHHVVKEINKKAYLSSLAIADHIIVTCDSTSMISEAAITGKPVYIAMMKAKRTNNRFRHFYSLFNKLGITKELGESVDNWSYDKLDEINRITPLIKQKMKDNGII
ncbi:MAG: nucleoside-diphosphate sugar epimerase [Candidatus Pelagibacter sp. TMED273]|nr:MAG: nucleoside-diphosphate sugar epimerase [Candidatus Pelagibacter sp. TMED273]|tara:strand:- start:775 stop:1725 length:951 start_codon:yes stop_codon:yes gene_type:complete